MRMIDFDKWVISYRKGLQENGQSIYLFDKVLAEQGLRVNDDDELENISAEDSFKECMEHFFVEYLEYQAMSSKEKQKILQSYSEKLLSIARERILKEETDLAYKTRDEVQYRNGYNDAVEEACKSLKEIAPYYVVSEEIDALIDNVRKDIEKGGQQ